MLEFKSIGDAELKRFADFFSLQDYRICDYSIGAIYMWKDFFFADYVIFDDFLVIRSGFEPSDRSFSFPVSTADNSFENIRKAIEKVEAFSKDSGDTTLTFANVPVDGLAYLERIYGDRMIKSFDRDWSDYVYDFNDLADFKGRKYNGQRNHINKFVRNYQNYSFSEITRDNIEELIRFYEDYEKDTVSGNEIEENEKIMTRKILTDYFDLPLVGGILKIGNEIAGFSVGEVVNKTLFVHIEKANVSYQGIYPFLVKEFAQMNQGKDLLYINREEDVGDYGLRKSKLSYHPSELLDKYVVEIPI